MRLPTRTSTNTPQIREKMGEKLAAMGRYRLQTRPLKNFAKEKLTECYPELQKLVAEMPDVIDALEYVGWVGAILKLMNSQKGG
jgi:hypothetical protein